MVVVFVEKLEEAEFIMMGILLLRKLNNGEVFKN